MKSYRQHAVPLAVLISLGAHVARATDASTKNTARALAQSGERDFKARRFAEARQKFQRAYEAVRLPTLARSTARALVETGDLIAAVELYVQATRLEPNDDWTGNTQQTAQAKAEAELAQLEPRIPRITITIEGASTTDVDVSVDDVKVPDSLVGVELRVNPGTRRVIGRRGSDVVEQKVELKERESKPVRLQFEQADPAATTTPVAEATKPQAIVTTTPASTVTSPNQPTPTRNHSWIGINTQWTLGWVGIGLGAAGVVLGATTGTIAGVKYGSLKDECPNDRCVGSAKFGDRVDSYSAMRTMSTIGFIVGGVGAAAGITLLVTTPRGGNSPVAGLWLTPNVAGLQGAF
jgi:hypothetical protein